MCIRELKKDFPEIKLIVSYADTQQKHLGIIYQATNWIYTGVSIAESFVIDGKKTHSRSIKPKHDWTSHFRSSFEYFAVNYNPRSQTKKVFDKFKRKEVGAKRVVGY